MSLKKQPRQGRNEPCICGSGKKYKKCCLEQEINGTELKCIDDASNEDRAAAETNNNHYNPCGWTALWNWDFLRSVKEEKKLPKRAKKTSVKCISLETGEIGSKKTNKIFCNNHQFKYSIEEYLDEYNITDANGNIVMGRRDFKRSLLKYPSLSEESMSSTFEGLLSKRDKVFVELRKIIIKISRKEIITTLTTAEQSLLLFILGYQGARCDQALISKKDIKSMDDLCKRIQSDRIKKDFGCLAVFSWKIYISKDSEFVMTDYSVVPCPRGENLKKFFCPLSPELLLEIDITSVRKNIDIVFEYATRDIVDEYTDECIKHSFTYIISSNNKILERIKESELFRKRIKERIEEKKKEKKKLGYKQPIAK